MGSLRGTETVLLVEDDLGLRKVIIEFLSSQGYTVLEAESGAAALTILEQGGKRLDALITDIMMPGMSGRDLASKVAEKFPQIRILYISGYTHDGAVQTRILSEKETFLPKPFAPTDLARKLRELLAAQEYPGMSGLSILSD